MDPFKIFIGRDSREPIAWQVLAHSILRRATQPIAIYPLSLPLLKRCYWRERGPTESTEFSLTRFLVPYLCGFKGFALFLDCDMLCRADIGDIMLYPLAYPGHAVYVAQHNYIPKDLIKFDGHEQTKYPRKNWSSAMLFDCAKCTALTPEYVNKATGLELHRFTWLQDEQIGALPLTWNYLIGEENQSQEPPQIVHFTNAGPWHSHYQLGEYGAEWLTELEQMMGPVLSAKQAVA
jgi:hypothetical protein